MANWRELAAENRSATYELLVGRRWRSCASRGYYAVYAEVTYGLLRAGTTMAARQANPNHRSLPVLIGTNLAPLSPAARWHLSGLVAHLYGLRIIGDDLPGLTMDEPDAKICVGLMERAFAETKVIP